MKLMKVTPLGVLILLKNLKSHLEPKNYQENLFNSTQNFPAKSEQKEKLKNLI